MNEEDRQLFLSQMQGVTRLKQQNLKAELSHTAKKTSLIHKKLRIAHHEQHHIEHLWQHAMDMHRSAERVHAFASMYYAHPDVSSKKLQQLKQGSFATRCVIDLHGMTENQASEKLTTWLIHCKLRSDKFALIIHGKGIGSNDQDPILKNFVNWWLRNQPRVLAFCSAQLVDGGNGASYVLLK